MECIIHHDGVNWCLTHERLTLSSPTLTALDASLARAMRENSMIEEGERKKIFMRFDNSTLPQVIRQYAQHYFNRVVEIKG